MKSLYLRIRENEEKRIEIIIENLKINENALYIKNVTIVIKANKIIIFILIKYFALLINNLRIKGSRRSSILRTRREIKGVLKENIISINIFFIS